MLSYVTLWSLPPARSKNSLRGPVAPKDIKGTESFARFRYRIRSCTPQIPGVQRTSSRDPETTLNFKSLSSGVPSPFPPPSPDEGSDPPPRTPHPRNSLRVSRHPPPHHTMPRGAIDAICAAPRRRKHRHVSLSPSMYQGIVWCGIS